MKKSILVVCIIALFSSCNGTKNTAQKVAKGEIPSGKYEIRSINGAAVYKLFFEVDASEKRIFGKTNCNNFSGDFTNSDNSIKIGPLVTTKMYCEEHVMKVESSLFKAFGDATRYVFDNNMFTLSSEEGVVLRAYRLVSDK